MKYFLIVSLICFCSFGMMKNDSFESKDEIESVKEVDDTLRYIFMGHTYQYYSPQGSHLVDYRIENLDLSKYSRIWLGGDITSESSLDLKTMEYIDSIFDLADQGTQFALGNHDIRNGNIQYYEKLTTRKSYNVNSQNGVVSICMNTQLNPSNCEELNKQFQLIKNVCDTIQESSHLVLLLHSCIFSGLPGLPSTGLFAHTDYKNWNANCNSSTKTFQTAIYPLLLDVKNRGIEIFVIMGDTGSYAKTFHQEVPDSIHFMANGIGNSKYTDSIELAAQPLDKVLIFEHVLDSQELNWSFQDLDSLFNSQ